MNPEALTLEEILPLLNTLLTSKGYEVLDSAQIAVIRAAWEGIDYKDMAGRSPFSWGKLHRKVAPPLWVMLGDAIGQPVTKRTLRQKLERVLCSQSSESSLPQLNLVERKVIGKVPALDGFVGRKTELEMLDTYLSDMRCIYLTGTAGIGKTSLMAALFNQTKVNLVKNYDFYVWKYCTTSTPANDIDELKENLGLPSDQTFISFLRAHKSLICIDGIEKWLKNDLSATEQFIQQITDSEHNSCVILTSREPLMFVERLKRKGRPIISAQVEGLSTQDASNLLNIYRLAKTRVLELMKSYRGSPLLLSAAAKRLKGLSESNIERFLQHKTSMIEEYYCSSYNELFHENSQIGKVGIYILAYIAKSNNRDSISKNDLISDLSKVSEYSFAEILKAIDVLKAYSLIFSNESTGYEVLSLPHDLRKYIIHDDRKIFPSTFSALVS